LLTGLLVFCEARRIQGLAAGLLAAAMFLLNPVILAHGHIIHTDIGMTLTYALAVVMFTRLLETRSLRNAVWAGLSAGLALAMKFTAVILAPTFILLWLVSRWRRRQTQLIGWKHWLTVAGVAWGVLLLIYAPHWSPAPPLDPVTAAKLGVPNWLIAFRSFLIPAAYFKGLAMTTPIFASIGLGSYLNGVWSATGWWYYYPVAFCMKSPLPFLVFLAAGMALAIRFRREVSFGEIAGWTVTLFYFLCAIFSKTNIGVRHVLPVFPLIAITAACALARWAYRPDAARLKYRRWVVAVLPAAALVVVLFAYPHFLSYLNPLAGGTERGYEHLLDSNYDWGQDFIRLKSFIEERKIDRVYLQAFGTEAAIDYYKIPREFVTSETAKQIRQGYLVVSAHMLMRPEWHWLRESRQPIVRVGYTLFVYRFGDAAAAH